MQYKYYFSSILYKLDILFNYLKLFIYIKLLKFNSYQENYYFKNKSLINARDCKNRLKVIKKNINLKSNILDIGCNNGFFLFNLLDKDSIGLGIDSDRNSIIISNSTSFLKNKKNISFLNINIHSKNIKNIPSYDTILFMSVFHHLVYNLGKEESLKILKLICQKTNENLIFDTGQINEGNYKWTNANSFIGNDFEEYFKKFFLSHGFKKFLSLGDFQTNISKNKRRLFLVSKIN